MSTPIKIDDVMFSEIKMLQSKFQESIYKLGHLQIEKMELDRRVNNFVETEKKLNYVFPHSLSPMHIIQYPDITGTWR